MKHIWLLFLISISALSAQIQVLPDIDVTGESQIRIFLYKKAFPHSRESLAADSISAFFPRTLPEKWVPPVEEEAPLMHYLNVEANTIASLEGSYKYYPGSEWLKSLGARASVLAPQGGDISRHAHLSADLMIDEDDTFRLNFLHFDSELSGLDSRYSLGSAESYHERLEIWGIQIRRLANNLRVHSIRQDNMAFRQSENRLNLHHHSIFDFGRFDWANVLDIYGANASIHTYVRIEDEILGQVSIHAMNDGGKLIAAPGFAWRLVTDFDQELSISNSPFGKINDYWDQLEKYRWLYFDQANKNTSVPLNLSISFEDISDSKIGLDNMSWKISNNSQYRIDEALLTDSVNPDVPALYFSDVFSNESRIRAAFGEGSLRFEQDLALKLAYMANDNWIRKPYEPLLKAQSVLRFVHYPYHADLEFKQEYFRRDHHQDDLPQLFDLGLRAAHDIDAQSQIYVHIDNLLNAKSRQFTSLPDGKTSIGAGLILRF